MAAPTSVADTAVPVVRPSGSASAAAIGVSTAASNSEHSAATAAAGGAAGSARPTTAPPPTPAAPPPQRQRHPACGRQQERARLKGREFAATAGRQHRGGEQHDDR